MKEELDKKENAPTSGAFSRLWQRHTLPDVTPVPFALMGLTTLFGMGRGGHHR